MFSNSYLAHAGTSESRAIPIRRPLPKAYGYSPTSPTSVIGMHALSESVSSSVSTESLDVQYAMRDRATVVDGYVQACSDLIAQIHEARAMHGLPASEGAIDALARIDRTLKRDGNECSAATLATRCRTIRFRRAQLSLGLREALSRIDAIKDASMAVYSNASHAVRDPARIDVLLGSERKPSVICPANDRFFAAMLRVHRARIESPEAADAIHAFADVATREKSQLIRFLVPNQLAKNFRYEELDMQRNTRSLAAHASILASTIKTLDAGSHGVFPVTGKSRPYLHRGVGIVASKIAYVMALQSSLRVNTLLAEIAASEHLTPDVPQLVRSL